MKPFKCIPLALLLALGVASSPALAAEAPLSVPGEPVLAPRAEPVVAFRDPSAVPSRMSFGDMDLRRIATVQKNNARDRVAPQIGINRAVSEAATPLPPLRWKAVDGGRVARIEVASADALGLRVALKFAAIPAGLEMRFSGSLAPALVHRADGPTIAWQHRTARTYWTPTTDGDRQTIELFVPAGTDTKSLGLQVVQVSHLLTNSLERFSLAKAIGDSGACNVDVVCRVPTLGDDYVDTENSVARMVFSTTQGTYTCTGTLLADSVTTSQIPYFWTADHCISNQAEASTLNTYWGFEANSCGSGIAAANVLRAGGADYLFSDPHDPDTGVGTDAALLRLRDTPPAGAYFSGWNAATLSNGVQVLAVHHPSGDLKKSSLGQKIAQDPYLHEVGWTSGTTEGGSSGSGLFTKTGANGAYELRGGLYGGFASCDNDGNLSDPDNRDYYSRLDAVYDDVKQWLGTGAAVVPGPTRDYTGAWYVPTESGWGLTAFQYDNAEQVLFVLFFIYDANGLPRWYEFDGTWTADDVRTGNVMQSNANQPWSTSFNPALRSFTPVGTATLTFTSATTATLNFTVNGVTRNVTLQKL
jgi:lysyl endopeptidase